MDDNPVFKIAISRYGLDKKIPKGDPFWPKFNASFDNLELDQEHIVEAVYRGQALTTWHKDHWRVGQNYLCGQYLGLDFDTGDKKSSMEALYSDPFISRYGAFIYSTLSHTPESPRSRVIFLLDQPIMQARNYALAAAALIWLFGGQADRKCKDAVRFFYGSPGCEFELIGNVLPLEMVKKLIADYQETGAAAKKKASTGYHAPASQKEVQEALRLIPPWGIDYDEWVSVLMGIHAEFGDAGLPLAENWADGDGDEVTRKWNSFHNNGNIAGAVTIATVFGIAKQFGWKKNPELAAV